MVTYQHGCPRLTLDCLDVLLLSADYTCLRPPFTCSSSADMEDDLMFSMEEEEEASAKRPPLHCRGASQRACSLSESNPSEDDDEDHFILPILDDSAREICHYLKDLVNTRQLSTSLPKSSFTYRVNRRRRARTFRMLFHVQTPLSSSLSEEQEAEECVWCVLDCPPHRWRQQSHCGASISAFSAVLLQISRLSRLSRLLRLFCGW